MEPKIKVYGALTCPDTRRARAYFKDQSVTYVFIDVDADEEGLRLIKRVNNGNRTTPTIFFEDGSVMFEPTNAELADKLGL